MLAPRWRKVLRDFWGAKTRTFLVVLSIATGIFAVGVAAHMYLLVERDLAKSYASVNPADATIFLDDTIDDDLIRVIGRLDGVREAEGRNSVIMRFRYAAEGEWFPILITAIPDYTSMHIDKVAQQKVGPYPDQFPNGAWPPPNRELLVERTSLLSAQQGLLQARLGDTILVQAPDGRERQVPLAGLCYDFARLPATFSRVALGYVTPATMEWLGGQTGYNELNLLVTAKAQEESHVKQVADRVRDQIERSGHTVSNVVVNPPGKAPLDDVFRAISLSLGSLGFFSLFLGGSLVVNTVSALLTEQRRQIGMMKAIGARVAQIAAMYLVMVSFFGILALAIAVPLAALAAWRLIGFLTYLLNFKLTAFEIPPSVVAMEIAMGLLVPLMSALIPILHAARLTVREAVSSYGLGEGYWGMGPIDRFLERIRSLPRPMTISLRNTFRRKNRLMLTLVTLILACAIFISVLSVRASLFLVVDDFLQYFSYDAQVTFNRAYSIARIQEQARFVPGIARVEYLDGAMAYRIRPDDSESKPIQVMAVASDTAMFNPQITAGRWLIAEDENAIVLNSEVIRDEPDIHVGDTVALKIGERKATWRVVGIYKGLPILGLMAHVNYSYFARAVRGRPEQANAVALMTLSHDAESQSQITSDLEGLFKNGDIHVTGIYTSTQMRSGIGMYFDIIMVLLLTMSTLVGVVGALGLLGTMALNVLERTREIGVMRAIGASTDDIQQIVVMEGILIGVLGWLVGTLIAVPLGKLLSDAVGIGFLGVPLRYDFSTQGTLICLVGVVILSAVASFLPALRASQLTVRQVLVYE